MRHKKLLISAIVVLAVGLAAETVYLYNLKKQDKAVRGDVLDELAIAIPSYPKILPGKAAGIAAQNWDPFMDMQQIQKTMNRLFDQTFTKNLAQFNLSARERAGLFNPKFDLKNTSDSYIVTMDLPGMDKESISVEAQNGFLVISGERKNKVEENSKANHFYWQERTFGQFSREISLPADSKWDQISAQYKNGVLTVTVPREATKISKLNQKVDVK